MDAKGGIETRNYSKSSSEVFSAIAGVLDGLKMKITAKDENAGTITASSGFSITSTGSNISIEVKPAGEGSSVTIEVKPKMKIVATDWGRGSREIKQIFASTEEKLGIVQKEGELKGGAVCPSCGKPVNSGDKFCQGCGAKV